MAYSGCASTLPLRHEQVEHAVVVDVRELGMPRGRRQHVAARERTVSGDLPLECDVLVRRRCRSVGECLQLVVALAGEEDLGIAVAGDVGTGDAHPPDAQRAPAVGLGVRAWCRLGIDAPQLIRAVAVVVAVVGHAQVAPARTAPVAEQDRQRAVPRRECDGRGVAITGGIRPQQAAVGARLTVGRQVVAERQRRQRVVALPRGAEGHRPRVAAVDDRATRWLARTRSRRARGGSRPHRRAARRGR